MRILIAEDDPVSRRLLESSLQRWSYDVVVAADGGQAWELLQQPDGPKLAILDWMMPEVDGVDLCRKARELELTRSAYLILLTARGTTPDLVSAFEAGADDYLTKPFNRDELRARVRAGERVLELQGQLSARVRELETALAEVKQLRGILPICCYCKSIRHDEQYWHKIEDYLTAHTDVDFSHGICPDCWENVVNKQMEEMWGEKLPYEG